MIKRVINTPWNFLRIVRLVVGVAVMAQGLLKTEYVLVLAGGLVAMMALFQVGCCGSSGCAVPQNEKRSAKKEDIPYEEVA